MKFVGPDVLGVLGPLLFYVVRFYLGLSCLILADATLVLRSRRIPIPIEWAATGVFDRWPGSAGSSNQKRSGAIARLVFLGRGSSALAR